MELGPLGIRVNAVQCGPIRSDMTDQWTDEYRAAVMKKIPLGRLGTPEDVAALPRMRRRGSPDAVLTAAEESIQNKRRKANELPGVAGPAV